MSVIWNWIFLTQDTFFFLITNFSLIKIYLSKLLKRFVQYINTTIQTKANCWKFQLMQRASYPGFTIASCKILILWSLGRTKLEILSDTTNTELSCVGGMDSGPTMACSNSSSQNMASCMCASVQIFSQHLSTYLYWLGTVYYCHY